MKTYTIHIESAWGRSWLTFEADTPMQAAKQALSRCARRGWDRAGILQLCVYAEPPVPLRPTPSKVILEAS